MSREHCNGTHFKRKLRSDDCVLRIPSCPCLCRCWDVDARWRTKTPEADPPLLDVCWDGLCLCVWLLLNCPRTKLSLLLLQLTAVFFCAVFNLNRTRGRRSVFGFLFLLFFVRCVFVFSTSFWSDCHNDPTFKYCTVALELVQYSAVVHRDNTWRALKVCNALVVAPVTFPGQNRALSREYTVLYLIQLAPHEGLEL